jgi:hypothetical protein
MLAIEGMIVTIDAMGKAGPRFRQAQPDEMTRRGCQREIVKKVTDKKAGLRPGAERQPSFAPKGRRGLRRRTEGQEL